LSVHFTTDHLDTDHSSVLHSAGLITIIHQNQHITAILHDELRWLPN